MTTRIANRAWRALSNVTLVLSSTVIALLFAEVLARVIGFGESLGRLFVTRGVATRTIDGIALWSSDAPRNDGTDLRRASADRDAFKIVGLGDSIMYGVGLSKDETYLEHTRRILANRSKRIVEILNLAVPGYNTMQENAVYKEVEGQIKPDLVLVHYWGDDFHEYRVVGRYVVDFGNGADDGRLPVGALPVPPRVDDFLLVHSRLYDLLSQVAAHRRPEKKYAQYDWTRVSKPLAEIQERIQRAGGRLLVLDSPALDGPAMRPTDDLPLLQQLGSERGFEVINLSEWLQGVDTKQIALDSCHFNAEGHKLIAERLAEYLLQHDLKK